MAIGRPSFKKRLAQSTISAASFLLATESTENLLLGVGAYISAMRGVGWSPSLEDEARCAAHCLRQGNESLIIDAGANVGDWLKAFHQLVPRNAQIYAFEPQPAAAARIRELAIDRCEVLEFALGEQTETRRFFTSQQSDSMASLFERHDTIARGQQYNSFDVPVIRLDDFVAQHSIRQIDFMKMDLEGGEFQALRGATECIKSGILRAFSFEFGISNVNSRVFFRDIYDFLVANDYEISRVTPARRLIPIENYSEDHECFARTTTFVARKRQQA